MGKTLAQRMEAAGFREERNRGSAPGYVWIKCEADGFETIVESGDYWLPSRRAQEVSIGEFPEGFRAYVAAWGDGAMGEWMGGYTFGQVLAALEYPSDDYTLLSLRLNALYNTHEWKLVEVVL